MSITRPPSPWRIVERNARVGRRYWYAHLAGGAEPFLFLFSVGIGVGALIDAVEGPGGVAVDYRSFVAPGMLAAAVMNTVIFDTAINFFIRVKYIHTYEAMLATPLRTRDVVWGELAWSLARVSAYAAVFVVTMLAMGLLESAWAILLIPATILLGAAFGSLGLVAATHMRSWLDFDLVFVAAIPMFLFSATFFPLSRYPEAVQWIVRLTPLFHGADLLRRLALGGVGPWQVASVVYLAAIAVVGTRRAERRVADLLQP